MKKLLLLVAWVFCINCGIVMASSPDIAVAVVHGQFAAELSCEDELMVRVPDTGEEMVLKPDRYFVNAEGGTVNLGAQKFGAKTLRFVVKENGKPIEVNKKAYRGSFEVRISADGKTLDVVNVLPLEQYLYSVVGEEIPVIFPDEAIKAQAVAARSLAYNRLGNRSRLGYDLKASEEGQDYYGLTTEKQAINKLVDVTAGMVVTYNGQPIEAVYHQSGGGQTETVMQDTETAAAKPKKFIQVDDSYFDDAVFIGDSRTVGLHDYGGLDHSDFFATVGMNIYDLWKDAFCEVNGKKVTLEEALKAKQYKKVYFQIGINEMGRGTLDGFMNEYQNAVEKFKTLQPDAVIYVQAIMHVTQKKSDSDPIFNNPGIDARNQRIQQLADGVRVFYIDVNEVVCDDQGGLKQELTFDNLHLYGSKYNIWVDFLKTKGIGTE